LFKADVIACEDTRNIGFLIKMLNEKSIRNEVMKMYPDHPGNATEEKKKDSSDDIDEDDIAI
jgi:16S rRNA C1402 (ribose-2'-O) methylase RsmI